MTIRSIDANEKYICPNCGKQVKEYVYDVSRLYYNLVDAAIAGSFLEQQDYGDGIYYETINAKGGKYIYGKRNLCSCLERLEEVLKSKGLDVRHTCRIRSEIEKKRRIPRQEVIIIEFEDRVTCKVQNTNYDLLKRCPECLEKVPQLAGKYPQILVSVVGSKGGDARGFIVSAINKFIKSDICFRDTFSEKEQNEKNSIESIHIELIQESDGLSKGRYGHFDSTNSRQNLEAWNFDTMKSEYEGYYHDARKKYPALNSQDPYDDESVHTYTFRIEYRKKVALLTIVEFNRRFLYRHQYLTFPQYIKMKGLLKASGYVLFVLDALDAKDDNYFSGIKAWKTFMNDSAVCCFVYNISSIDEFLGNMNPVYKTFHSFRKDEIYVEDIVELLKTGKMYIKANNGDRLIQLFEKSKKRGFFICSSKERMHNDNYQQPVNCEAPFYWILIQEGFLSPWVIEKYPRIVNKEDCILHNQQLWKHIETQLTQRY